MRAGIDKNEFKFIEGLLTNHRRYPKWINEREQEILYPYRETDGNIGGGSSGIISNETERIASMLVHDKRLNELKKQFETVSWALGDSNRATREIIVGYYMTCPKVETWRSLSEAVNFSQRHCKRMRDNFVVKVARELNKEE